MKIRTIAMSFATAAAFTALGVAGLHAAQSRQPVMKSATDDPAAHVCDAGEERGSGPVFADRNLARLFRSASSIADPAQRRAALTNLQSVVESAKSPADRAIATPMLAHEFYRAGDYLTAQSLFVRITSDPANPVDVRIDSWRMIGQISLFALNDPAAAVSQYSSMLDLVQASAIPDWQKEVPAAESLEKRAYALHLLGRFQDAAADRAAAVELYPLVRTVQEQAWLRLNAAADFEKAGRFDSAAAQYERVLSDYPQFGREDGQVVSVRLGLVNSLSQLPRGGSEIDGLWSMWQDPSLASFTQILPVGVTLAKRLRAVGRLNECEVVLLECLARTSDQFPQSPFEQAPEPLVGMHKTCLLNLASLAEQQRDMEAARQYFSALVAFYPNDPASASYWELSLPPERTPH